MTQHVVLEAPDSVELSGIIYMLERMGLKVVQRYQMFVVENDGKEMTLFSTWRTTRENVPVFDEPNGEQVAALPLKNMGVMELKQAAGVAGKWFEHNGAGIPGLAGWSQVEGNFERTFNPPIILAPPPMIEDAPTLSWPLATAINQLILNAVKKEFGGFGVIPIDIANDMTFKDEARKINHRQMLYKDLKTARALENWNLPPLVLERVKDALRKYNPPLF